MNVNSFFIGLFLFLMFSCSNSKRKEVFLSDVPVEYLSFHSYSIDSILLYPRSLNIYQDFLLIMEPRLNDSIYSLWDRNTNTYLCSFGAKGVGPNQLINPRSDYYFSTDSTFFILDSNIEREVCLKNNQLHILRNNPIVIPDAINQMVKIGVDKYITAGLTSGKNGEHILYENGDYSFFGEYPDLSIDDEERFKLNYKLCVGDLDKKLLFDFYFHKNLIRIYDFSGKLINDININTNSVLCEEEAISKVTFFKLKSNNSFLASLYNMKYSMEELYSGTTYCLELQLWNWNGELKRRIMFDKPFDLYTISEDNVLYAIDSNNPYMIFIYDFKQ